MMTDAEETDPRIKAMVGKVRGAVSGVAGAGGKPAGDQACILIQPEGVTVYDTQGLELWRMVVPIDPMETERQRAAREVWESYHCTDCGERVARGAMFCDVCKPYGFWHWLKYYSVLKWVLGGGMNVSRQGNGYRDEE